MSSACPPGVVETGFLLIFAGLTALDFILLQKRLCCAWISNLHGCATTRPLFSLDEFSVRACLCVRTRSDGGGFVYKLVTVDSLAVYCDEPRRPPAASKASSQSLSSLVSGNSKADTDLDGVSLSSGSFLAAGLSDEVLEGMFKRSLTSEKDSHSYVVIPASPSLRLRVQRGGDGGGGARCKAQAFFTDVGYRETWGKGWDWFILDASVFDWSIDQNSHSRVVFDWSSG